MFSLLTGLKFIHEQKVIHGDMKPSNIVINEDFTVKLNDFVKARTFTAKE